MGNQKSSNQKCEILNLTCNNFNFNQFSISDGEYSELSEDTIYNRLNKVFIKINELKKVKLEKDGKKEEKAIVDDTVS